ncbi:unnamed protein product, partial [Amoebophrya sp. A25]
AQLETDFALIFDGGRLLLRTLCGRRGSCAAIGIREEWKCWQQKYKEKSARRLQRF